MWFHVVFFISFWISLSMVVCSYVVHMVVCSYVVHMVVCSYVVCMVECWNKWITDTLPFTRDNGVTTVELQSLSSRVWKISCSPDSRPKYVTSQPCMHPCIHASMYACNYPPYMYLFSSSSSLCFPHGIRSSWQPLGIPL